MNTGDRYENLTGFRWIPAGLTYFDHMGSGAYVRYKRNTGEPIRLLEQGTNHAIVQCPDRDLVLIGNQYHNWAYRPPEGVYDAYVSFSLNYPKANRDNDIAFYMLNYERYINSKINPDMRLRARIPNESMIVADSGGYQMSHGHLDWVDPVKLISWYNANVDIGMTLDLQTSGLSCQDDIDLVAKAQAANNRILASGKRSDLELFNIVHGNNLGQMLRYEGITANPSFTRLAVGGLQGASSLYPLATFVGVAEELKGKFKHFHKLGVGNALRLLPLLRYAANNPDLLITADSSTAMRRAQSRFYGVHPTLDSPISVKLIGISQDTIHSSQFNVLSCQCPVCSTIKYFDVLSVLQGSVITPLLGHHNIFQANSYFRMMFDLAKRLSLKDLDRLVKSQLGERAGFSEMRWGLRFVDEVAESGYTKATKKFSAYLSEPMFSVNPENDDSEYKTEIAKIYIDYEKEVNSGR